MNREPLLSACMPLGPRFSWSLMPLAALCACLGGTALAEGLVQDDLVQAEILPGWRTTDGTHMAALHLRLAPEWKTYWRAPGDAGMPPLFNWSGSENLVSVAFHWPTPIVFDVNGTQTIGYRSDLVLPFEVTAKDASQPILLNAAIDLGICKDICVPANLALSATLATASAANASDAAIKTALAERPESASEAGVTAVNCAVENISDGLQVTALMELPAPTAAIAEIVVLESGLEAVWVSNATVRRDGTALSATVDMVAGSGKPFDLDPAQVVVTVLAQERAIEITGCPLR